MTIELRDFRASFGTDHAQDTVAYLRSTDIARRTPDGALLAEPQDWTIGKGMRTATAAEVEHELATSPEPSARMCWRTSDEQGRRTWHGVISCRQGHAVKLVNQRYPVTMALVLDLFRHTPHQLGTVSTLDPGWPADLRERIDGRLDYGFSDGHWPHGLACAFKGAGHDRLVHRRWLEHGPWRLIRDEALDLSVVQFHELAAHPPLAVEQAWPGHRLIGLSNEGGTRSLRAVIKRFEPSFFDPVDRTSIVMVHDDREVSPQEMLEAAEVKLRQPYPDIHVDQVRFLFMREANARRHMHALWLRGLSCHAIDAQGEVDLLDGYHAEPPPPPDWVQREQDRDGLPHG